MTRQKLEVILQQVKSKLNELYEEQLESIILYGSQARGEAKMDSDIDILVVLKSAINPYAEIDRTSEFISQLCLDYDAVIYRHFISAEAFTTQNSPFLHNIRQEGIVI